MRRLGIGTLVVALGLGAAYLVFDGGDEAPEHLVNRIWVDRMPKSPQDKVSFVLFLDDPRIGAFRQGSVYEFEMTLFEWRATGKSKLRLHMLQEGENRDVGVEVTTQGCKPFDYCLALPGAPRGPQRYVSMKDWVVDGDLQIEAAAALTPWL